MSMSAIKNPDNTYQRAAREIFANEAAIVELDHKALLTRGKVMEN